MAATERIGTGRLAGLSEHWRGLEGLPIKRLKPLLMLGFSAVGGYNSGMNFAAELAPFDLPPELVERFEQWADRTREEAAGAHQRVLEVSRLEAELKLSKLKIDALVHELAVLKRLRFGARSEAMSADMKDLFDETLAADVAACEARLAEQRQAAEMGPHLPPAEKPKRDRAGRQPLPEQLPRVEHLHEPETCTCGQCGQALVRIGEDVTEKLSIVPAEFFVERHIYPKYACRPCETLTAAPAVEACIRHNPDWLARLEKRRGGAITLQADPALAPEQSHVG